ncbi:MAG: hypothetical protein HRT88_17575 [Lentisphaeraceae bacterium]|nr:hypothetical protein [Lentisphaeraceae bacterium]
MKKTILLLLILISFTGCNKTPKNTKLTIGPQFWIGDLSEYKRTHFDVANGMGGRWITARYKIKKNHTCHYDEIKNRFISILDKHSWSKVDLPKHKYVMSQIFETSTNDLSYQRSSTGKEPNEWFFNMVVHISPDAETVCLYCQVGW